ncbi:hypothetical protein BV20DRAFT_1057144 [Pilatotrama ljubarskyi]|nr:hypothetical protein BV20DRAFT_1057144 [Pilatotrama ljubarskyi]
MPPVTTAALPSALEAAQILPPDAATSLALYSTVVLPAEQAALNAAHQLIHARVVGYLLLYAPSSHARRTLESEVALCQTTRDPHPALFEIGAKYVRHLIVLFRESRGRTPTPSDDPSQPASDPPGQDLLSDLQRVPRDHSSAKALALRRDAYRCMVTGRIDTDSFLAGLTTLVDGESPGSTNCCHIFPDSLGSINVAGATEPRDREPATVWSILTRFGYQDICEELDFASTKANLHRLENIMTLDVTVRDAFDQMNMWFEAIDGRENTYKIVLAAKVQRLAKFLTPEQVTFTSDHPELPLPSPKYLRVHAACCRVAHMSGAAEHLDLIFRDMEDLKVLAHDGTSADVLSIALHSHLAAVI